MVDSRQAAGGGGHHAKGQYGVQVCTVGMMEFVLEKGTVGDLSLDPPCTNSVFNNLLIFQLSRFTRLGMAACLDAIF